MQKRGQVTIFIIVGIVVVISILTVFFLRNKIVETIGGAERVNSYLEGQMKNVNGEVKRCVDEETKKSLDILGKQGGYFNPELYLEYYGNKISFLCLDIEDTGKCMNTMLTKEEIKKQLDERLKSELKNCINLEGFNSIKLYDYELIYDLNSLDVNSKINQENIVINTSFSVKIKKDEFELNKNDFVNVINIPMGEIISIVIDITNSEATIGNFNTLSYDLFSNNRYLVKKYRPFGNKLYTIQIRDYNYIFQFAVESKK